MIHYKITPSNLNSHLFSVELRFPSQSGNSYQLSLPAWLPGSYMIRDFAKNITEINACNSQGEALALTKLDKQSWQVVANDTEVVIAYQVFAFDLSVRTAYLDSERGFFNGSSTFLAVKEYAHLSCKLTIERPVVAESVESTESEKYQNWRVATGLTRVPGTEKYQFGVYSASNYAELIDGPVALGDFDAFEFTVEGVVHHMVFTSKHYGDRAQISTDVAKLCQHHIDLFGQAPFEEYWFITHLLEQGFGGLEHQNSTILQASRFDLPTPNASEVYTDNYKTFLSLCSHEYFHAWNVCRIKPKEFVPYNLQQEVYTTQLWAYEGITSYYDDFSLYRAGIISFDDYLAILSKAATRVYRSKGELKQSVTESSFYTWTKFYQQGPDAINNIVSYYVKGSLIALWLDLTIRAKSHGIYSLDNLMKELWIHFGRPGIGTQEHDFINIVNVLCGEDLSEQISALLHTAERVDLKALLAQVGVDMDAAKFAKLNSLDTVTTTDYRAFIGASYKKCDLGLKITQVQEDSPAAQAGLAVNDVIIALDKLKATESSIQKLAEHLPENTSVECLYFRDDQLLSGQLTFIDSPTTAVSFKTSDQEQVKKWQTVIPT